jgi:acetylornithine/LysW-gamma-L-lysine aminotransferase
MLCLAKSIAGGLPMGATLLGPAVGAIPPGVHGSTFGGNPLVCAAAVAALDAIVEERLPEQAAAKGEYLIGKLREIGSPLVREVRGLGLMVGLELKHKVAPYLEALQDRGCCIAAGLTVLRLLLSGDHPF